MNPLNLFKGRINRKKFIIGFLIYLLVACGYVFGWLQLDPDSNYGLIHIIAIILIVSYAVSLYVRRLHDTGHSGWWVLVICIPLGGLGLLIYSLAVGSKPSKS